jgi:hypothetical protein
MHTVYNEREARPLPPGKALLWGLLWLLWQAIRLPAVALLLLLEPFVSLVLTGLGMVGVLVAIILKCSGDAPHFPFWGMMACSIGCALLLMVYHALIRLLAR